MSTFLAKVDITQTVCQRERRHGNTDCRSDTMPTSLTISTAVRLSVSMKVFGYTDNTFDIIATVGLSGGI